MFGKDRNGVGRVETLLGRQARIEGDLAFEGGLHLDGHVAGNVHAAEAGSTLSISEHGTVEGSVDAPQVVLNGTVKGDIRAASRVVLGARARVLGNVSYGVIEMALGAEIRGTLLPLLPEGSL